MSLCVACILLIRFTILMKGKGVKCSSIGGGMMLTEISLILNVVHIILIGYIIYCNELLYY